MDFKNRLTKTPYLVLFIILISVGVGTASALITITLSGNVVITGDLDMTSDKIRNVATPTVSSDAATKGYVDQAPSTDTLALLGCTNDQIAKFDGNNWVCSDESSVTTCPLGTHHVGSWCISEQQDANTHTDAMQNCWDKGMSLAPLQAIMACDDQHPVGADCTVVTDNIVTTWIWAEEVHIDVDDINAFSDAGSARVFAHAGNNIQNEADWHLRNNIYVSFCVVPVNLQ